MTSLATHTLAPEQNSGAEEILASLCKAAADSLRLRVLRLLRRDAMDVSELCDVLDVRQPALSHHLKLMTTAGLLNKQRDGNHIFYNRRELPDTDPLAALQSALFAAADECELDDAAESRFRQLLSQREQNSRDFFHTNSERFREQQDLIAAPERYAEAVTNLIGTLNAKELALEVGPGEGWLLPLLAQQFDRVIAIDNAPAMLNAAKSSARQHKLSNVEFLLGDTSHTSLPELQASLVVINMVLHHTPKPESTLAEAALALAPGGALLVTELCEHRQGWARENCGDLWLGFPPEQIQAWAQAAGLEEVASNYLGQRNGFKLQVRLFRSPTNSTGIKETL